MNISIHAVNTTVDITICTSIGDITATTEEGVELQMLKRYIIKWWSHTKDRVEPGLEKYWEVRHELALSDGIAMNRK